MEYASATSKMAAVERMYLLAGLPPEPLGPGSKEKRSALEALGSAIEIDLSSVRSKHRCAEALARALGVPWDERCCSNGDTITLVGMNRLVDAAARDRLAASSEEDSHSLLERLLGAGLSARHATNEREQLMPQDLDELEQNIADYLSRLSDEGPVPEDFDSSPVPFSADHVRFDDGAWRQRLVEIQEWLYFSTTLDEDTSSERFDEGLADALGLDGTATRDALFDSLAQRLDTALALQDDFRTAMEGAVEGTTTLKSASLAWAESWDATADDEGVEQSGSISAVASTWPIVTFSEYAEDRQLNLSPSYQRADVWPTGDAQKLIESILRGIPLPSVIILERKENKLTDYEVVDGKQRLTSILRFMGKHPHAIDVVEEKRDAWGIPDLAEVFQKDYPRFRELWNHNERDRLTAEIERANHFPFPLRSTDTAESRNPLTGDLAKFRGRYYCQIRQEPLTLQGEDRTVQYIFEKTNTSYKIPVITYTKVTPAQVHEVFSLYNKQGKHLNAEEIRNALYHRLDLMKALLVTAGDSKAVVADVAPFLVDDWEDLRSTGETLTRYRFGDVGYKRSKVLSWVTAALVLDDSGKGGITRSTSAHINALLQRVADNGRDPLRKPETVRRLMLLVDHALDAHATPDDVWTKEFRSGSARGAGKWQELRLVSSLVALSSAAAVLEDELVDVFEEAAPAIRAASAKWDKPRRNQSKEQWGWMGFVVGEILSLLDVDTDSAHAALESTFGSSGLRTLIENAVAPTSLVSA